ncbi:hypothetical protein [Hydrogenophaga sp. NH-16]|uniref:hypothetical protein n=1 Tax=Hydrogenophaga sp. NH-16 TaxID=2184519 RepID=UPI000FD759A4|nr:hypothetical protein [Hydrogenophaga sp. NH-16]
MKKVLRSASSLALLLSLAACAPLYLDFLRPQAQGLDTMTQKVGHEAPELAFSFEFDDKADAAEGEVGSGYIVVTQDGKELQALPHAFEMPRERLDASGWLQFRDFNGDGLLDFKVTRLYAMDGKLPVDSLYQFDPKTGRYAQIDLVSNAGEIQPSAPNCVSLKVAGASGSPKVESHCYVAASGRWVRGTPAAARRGAAPDRVDAVCDSGAPELVACRRARIEQDKALLTLVRDYRAGRMQSLQAEHGKSYAQSYARHQDLDHSRWREYRDARCATQSREQAVPVKALPASVELCRYEWARDQLRRYKDQMARLGEVKGAKVRQ